MSLITSINSSSCRKPSPFLSNNLNFSSTINFRFCWFIRNQIIDPRHILIQKQASYTTWCFAAILRFIQTGAMIEHIKKLFLVIILLSCFTCFQRADYNLPLFTFAFFLWDFKSSNSQKSRLFYLFVATWIVDFIWLIYWGVTWGSAEYKQNVSTGASSFVMALSVISFLVKLVTIIMAFVYDPEVKIAVRDFVPNLKGICVYTPEHY